MHLFPGDALFISFAGNLLLLCCEEMEPRIKFRINSIVTVCVRPLERALRVTAS